MKVNVNRVIGPIPAKFNCECLNDNGELESVEIGLKLNRLKFRDVVREQFTEAMSKADKDPQVIGQILVDLIAEWEFYADDTCTEMLPITVENIIDRDAMFVMNLSEAVLGKLFPNPLKAANLVNGSEPAAKSSLASATNSEIATSSQPLAASGG
jgi:hypothetical protein